MTNVLRRERHREIKDRRGEETEEKTQTHRIESVTMDGKIGVMWPQAKEHKGMLVDEVLGYQCGEGRSISKRKEGLFQARTTSFFREGLGRVFIMQITSLVLIRKFQIDC